MDNIFEKCLKSPSFPFCILLLTIVTIFIVSACSDKILTVVELNKKEYAEIAEDGKKVQRKLQQTKEKLQTQNTVKKECSGQADLLYHDLLEGMDSLFVTWNKMMDKKHDQLIFLEEAANKNFSIWLAVIAAICTVLPVVLALHQNSNFHVQIEKSEKKLKSSQAELEEKLEAQKSSVEKLKAEMDRIDSRPQILSFFDSFSRSVNMLTNLQEIDINENVLLTCPKVVKRSLDIISENSKTCIDKFGQISSNLHEEDLALIKNSFFGSICLFREMLYRYENLFSGIELKELQRCRYSLSMMIDDFLDSEKSKNMSDYFLQLDRHIDEINRIFNEQLNHNE